jgi:hypothetical protein
MINIINNLENLNMKFHVIVGHIRNREHMSGIKRDNSVVQVITYQI